MNGGRDGCSVLWKMANFFSAYQWIGCRLETRNPKYQISHFPVGFPLMLFQLIYLHIPSKECIMVELRCGKKTAVAGQMNISLSPQLFIYLVGFFQCIYIYIHNYRYSFSFICFCGCVHIQLYIYIIVIAIYCYLHISVLWLFYVVYIHVRVKYVYRILYVCKIRRRRKVVEEYTPVDGKANQLALNRPTYVYPLIWHRSSF